MNRPNATPNFEGMRAIILHRPHAVVDALTRQLSQLGMSSDPVWPTLGEGPCDVLFYDADMGHDEQFPWPAAHTPMPAIALIGSEAPGRLAWAIRRGADAHLLKPVGSGGVFSALVIAFEAFEKRSAMSAELGALRVRLGLRQVLAEATASIMGRDGISADAAYAVLRREAMDSRLTIEQVAERIVDRMQKDHVRDRA